MIILKLNVTRAPDGIYIWYMGIILEESYNNCLRTIQEDAVLEALCEMTNIETEKALKIDKAGIGHSYDKIIICSRGSLNR